MANLAIFNGLLQPPKSVADYDQQAAELQRTQLQNQTLGYQNQAAQRGAQRADQLLQLSRNLPQGASDLDRLGALRGAGFYDEADKLDTSIQSRMKTQAQAAKDTAEAGNTSLKTQEARKTARIQAISQFTNPQDALAHIADGVAKGDIPQADGVMMAKNVPSDPAQFQQWQLRTMQALLTPEQQVKQSSPDANAKLSAQTSTANNAATNAAHLQSTGMSNAVQMRGQDLVNARTRESTAATMTKPFEVTGPDGTPMLVQQDKQGNITPVQGYGPKAGASKPLNDSQAKALGFGTRMQEADKLLNGLEAKGVSTPSMAKMAVGDTAFLGPIANAISSPDQQSVDQAQRDFVNAILRRESGAAISNSEFDNARRQYFSQPGDSAQVKSQKAANRKLALQGVLAEVPVGQRGTIGPNAPAAATGAIAAPAPAAGGFKIISVK